MHQIPFNIGKSKLKLLRGDDAHESRSRRWDHEDMSFSIENEFTPATLPPMSFNVLYVETPSVGLLQTPQFQLLAQTWQETVELVKPLLRFGFSETSLRTKCPYYNEKLYETSSGAILANAKTRRLMTGVQNGYFADSHQHSNHNRQQHVHVQHNSNNNVQPQSQDQQPQHVFSSSNSSSSPLGIGNLDFLNVTGLNHQHSPANHSSLIPKSNFLVPDIPSGTLVLALNLMAYWAITKQSRRSYGG